ncbi:AAA family ATPase [Bacillus mexicanus]|uniref:AAA family ATPase n=1 Tax=Bacillus mexicanus TaxID=2834415 RepID=UPI003D231BCB
MIDNIKLYIVDPNSKFIDQIEGYFFEKTDYGITVIGSSTNTSYFDKDKAKISKADIFLVSANLPDGTGIKIVEFLKKNSVTENKPILFTIDKQTRNHASIAQQKGVDKIFQKPFSVKELTTSIYELTKRHTEPETENKSDPVVSHPEIPSVSKKPSLKPKKKPSTNKPSTPFPPNKENDLFSKVDNNPLLNTLNPVEESISKTNKSKKTIVTFDSVSSTGKTSLLVNVAYAINKYSKNKPKICLVDLNLLFPSIAFHFLNTDLKLASRDIYDISADLNYLNEELLREALTLHQPTGIYMMNTPSDPEFIHKVSSIKSEEIERILVHLRDMFDVILIDTSNAITEDLVLFPMQFADKNIIVLEPNYLNVVGVNKFFYVLRRLEDTLKEKVIDKTHIVLNKETKMKSIYSDTTRDFLYNKEFIARVPEDPNFVDFANKGKFIVDSDSIAASSILDIANFIYPINPSSEKKKIKLPFFRK